MTGVRARVRAELTAEITAIARRQIATEGATGLSLRAIAREMGMASSAIYRYFPGRDELLTALIVEAYDTLGSIGERADAAVDRADHLGRWRAVAHAAFGWASQHTAEYALIFGTPVPGYVAPTDTVGPATRFTAVLVELLVDASAAGVLVIDEPTVSKRTGRDLRDLVKRVDADIPQPMLFLGLHAWSSLMGTISFILFGHLHTVIHDEDAFFADIVDRLGAELFGGSPT